MNATVIVDALTPRDAARCAELERILFPGDDPWSTRAFLDALAWGHPYLAARSVSGAPVGTARSVGGAPVGTARSVGGAPVGTARSVGGAPVGTARSLGELLVGYAGLGFVAGPPDAEAEVHTIGVDPAFQGRGVGRALLSGLLAIADGAHATVFLEVRTDNDVARALYESEGFTVVGLRRGYYRPSGADAHTMRRDAR